MSKHKKLILRFTGIILFLLLITFLIPNSLHALALNKEKVLIGEYWRILTYSFPHFNLIHLIENLAAMVLIGFIGYELKTNSKEYITVYLLTAVLAVFPLWFMIGFTAAGASSAIYALFGFVSFDSKRFGLKPIYVLIALLLVIFLESTYSYLINPTQFNPSLIQSFAHFSGLIFGVAAYLGLLSFKKYKKKKATFLLRGI